MAYYLLGDIQGCDEALALLLAKVDFSPSRDTLFCLGDLVNRGPNSLGVLRRLMALGAAARCLLGNHDLHLLAASQGVRKPGKLDTLAPILQADDCPALLDWVRHKPLAMALQPQAATPPAQPHATLLMVHAGVLPGWTAQQTLQLAAEVERALQAPDYPDFLAQMYGNAPDCWHDELTGVARLRVIVNALTRLRFCTAAGVMDFATKEGADGAPPGFMPWFEVPGRQTAGDVVAFGHWSTLGHINRPNLLALDTGCVWGGCLSAMRVEPQDWQQRTLRQIDCAQLAGTLVPA